MKRAAWIVLGLCLGVSSLARADEWSKTFTITGKPELRVETSDANIQVDTWDKNTIEARVTTERWKIGEGGVKIYDHQAGDSVELEVRLPHHGIVIGINRPQRVEVQNHMPREGKVNLHTGDGRIRLSNFKGDMQLESGDGREEVEGVDGVLRARTSDGRIEASGRFALLDLKTGDGRIEVQAQSGSTIASSWNLHTSDGSVILRVPQSLAADVDLHTGDGHITLELPVTVQGRYGERELRGKMNGGGNPLVVRTGDGSITLQKS